MAFKIGGLIGDALAPYALIASPYRSIATIIPHVVIEELANDELVITDHPVEIGAAITDHAFKRPAEVDMRCGWSNSTAQTEGFVQLMYQELLALQASRQPFSVSTGKRLYQNMLVRSLSVTTDVKSEYALNCVCGLREVILTSTSGTAASVTAAAPATAINNQSIPQATAPAQNLGPQVPIPAPSVAPIQ